MISGWNLRKQRAVCSQIGTGLCGLDLQLPTVLWKHKLGLAWKNESVTLWKCASLGYRLPKQIGTIRFLSTSHMRVALLRMTPRMVRKDSFTHHCLCPPQILRPPHLNPAGDADNQQRNVFVNTGFQTVLHQWKMKTYWSVPLPVLLWTGSEKSGKLALQCHFAVGHGFYRPTYTPMHIWLKGTH